MQSRLAASKLILAAQKFWTKSPNVRPLKKKYNMLGWNPKKKQIPKSNGQD